MSFVTNISISDVQMLLEDLEAGDQIAAAAQLDRITQMRDHELYQALGKVTANLHDTLNTLGEDTILLQHVKHDLPDVTERLQYVLQKTEEASSKTLAASESLMTKLDAMNEKVTSFGLSEQAELTQLIDSASIEITNIMMAQSFQDLTGQVLNRIMFVMASFERSLLDLVDRSGHDLEKVPARDESDKRSSELQGIGPNVTKSSQVDALSGQEDVDDLLSQMGL